MTNVKATSQVKTAHTMTSVLRDRPGFSGIFQKVLFAGIVPLPREVEFPRLGPAGASADILVSPGNVEKVSSPVGLSRQEGRRLGDTDHILDRACPVPIHKPAPRRFGPLRSTKLYLLLGRSACLDVVPSKRHSEGRYGDQALLLVAGRDSVRAVVLLVKVLHCLSRRL